MGFAGDLDRYRKGKGTLLALLVLGLPSASSGGSIAGVCPDGSAFIVHQKAQIPCLRAKLVEPSALPPLRPEYLPKPYPWMVDQKARNPNNPYNLIDAAEAIRAARSGEAPKPSPEGAPSTEAAPPGPRPAATGPALPPEELEALVELIELRQEEAPALLRAEDALGRGRIEVRFAYSRAFEGRVLEWLARGAGEARVLIFSVRAIEGAEFHGNLFFLQAARGFRPDPSAPDELGFLVGRLGPLEPGRFLVGYVVLPASFDPAQPMELWWNDRRIESRLASR